MRQTLTEIKVPGFHIDVYGHVNNARYLEYLELGRWDFITTYFNRKTIKEQQWGFIIINIDIHYRSPAYFDDILIVDSTVTNVGLVRVSLKQNIYCKEDQKLLAEATVRFVLMDLKTLRPIRIKGNIKKFVETGELPV